MSVLITTAQAVALTGLPAAKFAAVMRQHGVVPVDFGRGRGNGLRWEREAVMLALYRGVLGKPAAPDSPDSNA